MKNVDIFEKWIHFQILCIFLKNETSLQSWGHHPLRWAFDSLYVARAIRTEKFLAQQLLITEANELIHQNFRSPYSFFIKSGNFQIINRRKISNFFKIISNFWKLFYEKVDYLGKKIFENFEKCIHFLIHSIVWKKFKYAKVRGLCTKEALRDVRESLQVTEAFRLPKKKLRRHCSMTFFVRGTKFLRLV